MTQFNFIRSENAYGTKFFQLPQVLLYGEKYKELSDSAKLGYVVLRDRLEYSLQNNWIDDENRVYFIFTNHELQNLFGWSDRKISKVKKELEEAGLLFQINQGFDPKKKKNLPNRLYLADLEVTAKDVYIKQDFANKAAETLDMSGTDKMQDNLYKTNLDTNKDTSMLDFSSTNFSQNVLQKQNQDIVANASEFLVSNGNSGKIPLEAETIKLISLWSANDPALILKRWTIFLPEVKCFNAFRLFYERYGKAVRTITADNGSEFISWDFLEYVQKELKIKLYYATPSSPQQRGSNENRNRKLRDWYPKGTSFKDVKQRQLDEVASKMNAMPLRQALDGKRPMVVFEQEYKAMQRYRRAYEKRKQRMLEVKKQEFENN
ncbi:IS30 family transposase [Enterococcus faecalis]|uniref:IS30 family transposase n=2 Tax=Enterococcus TaxID=1350 RepID=UPI00215D26C5|nr:IS30 family transposase [Enterococcus faecalis]